MKANELRIGNYVKLINDDRISTIGYISETNVSLNENGVINLLVDIEGIPLTEEWLIKFGFTKNHNLCYGKKYIDGLQLSVEQGWLYLNKWNNDKKLFDDIVISNHCKHVHQLQNLCSAIEGEELTIKE